MKPSISKKVFLKLPNFEINVLEIMKIGTNKKIEIDKQLTCWSQINSIKLKKNNKLMLFCVN